MSWPEADGRPPQTESCCRRQATLISGLQLMGGQPVMFKLEMLSSRAR